jgi:hypothetical protein
LEHDQLHLSGLLDKHRGNTGVCPFTKKLRCARRQNRTRNGRGQRHPAAFGLQTGTVWHLPCPNAWRIPRDYETLNGEVMSVNVFADSAIASGLIEASWKDEHGKMRQITLRFLALLQKQKGEWKLVATQSTRFNRPNPQ